MPEFVCDSDWRVLGVCRGVPFFGEHQGKNYCALHFPGPVNTDARREGLRKKLARGDYDFRGVWFQDDSTLSGVRFEGRADFSQARFDSIAYLSQSVFEGDAIFEETTFRGAANFHSVIFKQRANFRRALFYSSADFSSSDFRGSADFHFCKFRDRTTFTDTKFADYLLFAGIETVRVPLWKTIREMIQAELSYESETLERFYLNRHPLNLLVEYALSIFIFVVHPIAEYLGEDSLTTTESQMDFQYARIDRPERVFFHTVNLRPHWFASVDCRKFNFIKVRWMGTFNQEVKTFARFGDKSYDLLATTFQQLAANAEDNNRHEEASRFRYLAMDAHRKRKWHGLTPWRLSWWYWFASGYGERALRAFLVFGGLWIFFGWLYTGVSFSHPTTGPPQVQVQPLPTRREFEDLQRPVRALTYSLGVMTLQRPDPRPETLKAQALVTIEAILGPLQGALFALAIRRKFMR